MSKPKPITRKITRLSDGTHTGWMLYVEDYERAVQAIAKALGSITTSHAHTALTAIGIVAVKGKGAK